MEKIDFTKSVNELKDNFDFEVRKFSSFQFGDFERCKYILQKAIQASDLSVENFQWITEYDEVAKWMVDTKGKGLFLTGDVGRGKTNIILHAMPLMFYHLKKKVIKCTHANELKNNFESYKQKLFIAVDEIGSEPTVSDYGVKLEYVSMLFDLAESKSKTLFISTNLTSDEIQKRYGIRMLDRITRLCHIVKFSGQSLRK